MHYNLVSVVNSLFNAIPNIVMELYKDAGGTLSVKIPIGSKTGTGQLWADKDGNVFLNTRYSQTDKIELDTAVEDISSVAWGWYLSYKEHGLSSEWLPVWLKEGKISEKVVTKTEYVIN